MRNNAQRRSNMPHVMWLCLNTTLLTHFICTEHLILGFLLPRPTSLQRYKISLPLLTNYGSRSCGPGHLQHNHRKLYHVWDKSQLYLPGSRRLQTIRLKGHQQSLGYWNSSRTESSNATCSWKFPTLCPWVP